MRERDYILATNLARVGVLADVLRGIICDEAIPEAELAQVRQLIARWHMAGFKALEKRT